MGPTDITANPPVIEGYTDPAQFDAAYIDSRATPVKALWRDYIGSKITRDAFVAAMDKLATTIPVDAMIEGYNGTVNASPWYATMVRLALGVATVPAENGLGNLPVPPDLTLTPDPPMANQYVGQLFRAANNFQLFAPLPPPALGFTPPPMAIITDKDGHTYMAMNSETLPDLGILPEPGDWILLYVLLK